MNDAAVELAEEQRIEAEIGLAAARLATTTAVYETLMAGDPVQRQKLESAVLTEIGEPLEGPPIILDLRLAHRVEANRVWEKAEERARKHSWLPVDLAAAESLPPSPPTISDIVYPERVHVWSGEPETLKSLVAMAVALAEIREGRAVVYIDLENGVREATSRLRALGATDDELRQFLYIAPTEALAADILTDTIDLLRMFRPSVVFIDSYTGSLAINKCDPNSSIDIERHHQEVSNKLRSQGAGVVLLDHLPKNRDNRGRYSIGSERKIGVADIHLGFELVLPLSRGGQGLVKLITHKDRPGYLHRPKAGQARFVSTLPNGLAWTLEKAEDDPAAPISEFRPTILMERVSKYLEGHEQASLTMIEETVQGKVGFLRKAVDALVREQYVAETKGARNARLFTVLKPYRSSSDETTNHPDPVPTPSLGDDRDPVPTPSLTIPLEQAENTTPSHPVPTPSPSVGTTPSQFPSPPTGGTDWRDGVNGVTNSNENEQRDPADPGVDEPLFEDPDPYPDISDVVTEDDIPF